MVDAMNGKKVIDRKVAIALGVLYIILIASLGATLINYTLLIKQKDDTISSMDSQMQTLANQSKSLNATLDAANELVAYAEGGYVIRSGHTLTLKFGYNIRSDEDCTCGTDGPDPRTFCALYSPYNNSSLNLELKVDWIGRDYNLSLSVQNGNVFEPISMWEYVNASTIWSVNANWTDKWTMPISRGWYTVSLIGPIHLRGCGVCLVPISPPPMPIVKVYCTLAVTLSYEEKLSPFVLIGTDTY